MKRISDAMSQTNSERPAPYSKTNYVCYSNTKLDLSWMIAVPSGCCILALGGKLRV